MVLFGGVEAGGTKFVCAVGDASGEIVEKISIDTSMPRETLDQVFNFFDRYPIEAIGIGSFGPVDLDPFSDAYGFITTTPKKGWSQTDIAGPFKERYQVPVAFTTDVNAAAVGEMEAGAAAGTRTCLYLTVGTGIGGGAVVNGAVLEGNTHPEMGHLLVRRHPLDSFEGNCPYHEDCLEGMAAGPALEKRYGKPGRELSDEEQVWEIEAYYLAQALVSYTLTLSPEKIILGGGVMKQKTLLPLVRKTFTDLMADYVPVPPLETYIVSPGLGDDAGIKGALVLAERFLNQDK